jgi:hypothetical protein
MSHFDPMRKARPSPAVSERRVSRIAKVLNSVSRNKRSRTIAKGDGHLFRFDQKLIDLRGSSENPLCESVLTSTPSIVAQSSKRFVNDYASHSKKIESYPRTSESRSNGSVNQKSEAQARSKAAQRKITLRSPRDKENERISAQPNGSSLVRNVVRLSCRIGYCHCE